jgi:hypothetical protein
VARPKKGNELEESTYLGFRVPLSLKEAIESIAASKGVMTAEECRVALENHVRASDKKGSRK